MAIYYSTHRLEEPQIEPLNRIISFYFNNVSMDCWQAVTSNIQRPITQQAPSFTLSISLFGSLCSHHRFTVLNVCLGSLSPYPCPQREGVTTCYTHRGSERQDLQPWTRWAKRVQAYDKVSITALFTVWPPLNKSLCCSLSAGYVNRQLYVPYRLYMVMMFSHFQCFWDPKWSKAQLELN